MQEYVQMSYRTTLPVSALLVRGGELIQPVASSAGAGRMSGRLDVSTGPEIDD